MVQSWLRLRLYASPDRSAPGSSRESAHGRGPSIEGPFLRRVSPLHPEGLRGGYSTYHAPLVGLSIGKLSFYVSSGGGQGAYAK